MSSNDLSDAAKQVIARHLRSVKDLEVLLLLSERSGDWTAESVGTAMYIPPEATERILIGLFDAGLVRRSNDAPVVYRYDPTNRDDAAVRELADAYKRMRVRVIELIYGSPTDVIQSFADAFKFKRGGDR